MIGGVINGGDFNCDLIFDAVTQVDKDVDDEEEAGGWSGSAIFKDPGPGLIGDSEIMLTNEYTGTVTILDVTAELEEEALDSRAP